MSHFSPDDGDVLPGPLLGGRHSKDIRLRRRLRVLSQPRGHVYYTGLSYPCTRAPTYSKTSMSAFMRILSHLSYLQQWRPGALCPQAGDRGVLRENLQVVSPDPRRLKHPALQLYILLAV